MSIKSIAEGFTHLLFTNADIERIANARAYICNGCHVSEYGKSRYCKLTNGGCGCYLPAKRRAMSEECPQLKWKAEVK